MTSTKNIKPTHEETIGEHTMLGDMIQHMIVIIIMAVTIVGFIAVGIDMLTELLNWIWRHK